MLGVHDRNAEMLADRKVLILERIDEVLTVRAVDLVHEEVAIHEPSDEGDPHILLAAPREARHARSTMYHCHACGGEVELIDKVKRADSCEHCGADLHCCKNCKLYDPYVHNGCRESSTL